MFWGSREWWSSTLVILLRDARDHEDLIIEAFDEMWEWCLRAQAKLSCGLWLLRGERGEWGRPSSMESVGGRRQGPPSLCYCSDWLHSFTLVRVLVATFYFLTFNGEIILKFARIIQNKVLLYTLFSRVPYRWLVQEINWNNIITWYRLMFHFHQLSQWCSVIQSFSSSELQFGVMVRLASRSLSSLTRNLEAV